MGATKNLIGAGLVSVGMFILWGFVVAEYSKLGPLNEVLAAQEILLGERRTLLTKAHDLDEQYKENEEVLTRIALVAPDADEIAALLTAIEDIGRITGVTVSDIAIVQSSGETSKQGLVEVSMKLRSGYSTMVLFLDTIERNIRILDAQSLVVAPDTSAPGVLNFDLQATGYFFTN